MLDAATMEAALEEQDRARRSPRAMGVSRRPSCRPPADKGLIGPIMEYIGLNSVPIMGHVGQHVIDLNDDPGLEPSARSTFVGERVAFEVSRNSMLPKYGEFGDVIVTRNNGTRFELLRRGSRSTAEDRPALPEDDRASQNARATSTSRFNAKPINGSSLELDAHA